LKEAPHLLIRASAGTGKTWRLSGRFLALLLDGVKPERILATTFTRKAAGEILDRVLERLVEAVEEESKLAELARATGALGLDRERCVRLLAEVTRSLHSFQVRTIDSFFVHLVRLFALDLELPPDWRICDDRLDERLRSQAWQEVLAEEPAEALLLLLRELSKGGAGRRVQAKLLDETRVLRPALLESPAEAWDSFEVGRGLAPEELERALEAVERAPLPMTAKGEPHGSWVKARTTLLGRARDGLWSELITEGGLGVVYFSEHRTYYKKPIPDELLEALDPLFGHAVHEVLRELRDRNLAARSLLETFEGAYQSRKREEGAYSFGDLPHALAPRTATRLPLDERELDLWFRLDGHVDHLLLDEFQDTAPVQWRILAPIASEIASESGGARTFFCVGDVKQSIYSFRLAESRLLSELKRSLPSLAEEELKDSYRSSQVVLDTVNRVFESIEANSALEGDELEVHRDACRSWAAGFPTHEAAKELPGAAVVIEAREGDDTQRELVETTVRRVQRLTAEAPQASIGILLRRNAWAPRLIHRLREAGIDASGEGGNPLTDSRAVQVFLALLHLADHPADSAAAFHVETSPFARHLEPALDGSPESQRALSRRLRQRLTDEGLAEVVRDFAAEVAEGEAWSAWDRARFGQLLDQAFAFRDEDDPRPSAFVDHVRKKNVEAPGGSPVRVMTIHASKGLEFDAVVLPELSGKFVNPRADLFTLRSRPEELFERVSLGIKKALQPISPALRELYEHNLRRAVEDSLCVLYVAMTRAARRLELIVPWQDPDKKVKVPDAHHLLRAALAPELAAEPDEDGILWAHPENAPGAGWADGLRAVEEQPEEEPRVTLEPKPGRTTAARSLPRKSPSEQEHLRARDAATVLRPRRGALVGELVHACCEELRWIEEGAPERDSLAQLPALRRAPAELRETALDLFERALEAPAIRKALSREACEAPSGCELEVLAEEPFAIPLPGAEGEDELWVGAIDRLVLARDGDRVVHAEVVDYKSDRVDPAQLEAQVEHHAPQLRQYREVVARRYRLDPASIRARLLFLALGEVRDVD